MGNHRGSSEWNARREWRVARPGGWRPLELVAMIGGFAFYWPIGLAILFVKLWQKREGFSGDLFAFARNQAMAGMPAGWRTSKDTWTARWNAGTYGMRSTGNAAFDDWRSAELDRLEAERRKLADAEREFADHLAQLRKARDREEFDRFMSERHARNGGTTSV